MRDGATTAIDAMGKKSLFLLILAGMAVACAVQEETETVDPSVRTVVFNAVTQDSGTRTAFEPGEDGLYPTRWTDRDTAVAVSLNYGTPQDAKVIPAADRRSARFEYTTSAQAESYRFLVITPGAAVETLSPSRSAWQIRIPAEQTPTVNSPDEAAQILSATTGVLETLPTELDIRFSHVTSYGRLTLLNLPADLTVSAITLSCTTPLAGSWYLSEEGLSPCEASSTLVLRTSATENVWFACAPGDVSGATLKVIVSTDKGTYEKPVTLHEGRSFKPGRVASFSVDFSGIKPSASGEIYTLVTDASTLAAGDEILLVNQEETQAISTYQQKNNRSATAVTVQNHQIGTPGSSVQHFILGGSAGAWKILTGSDGKHLYTTEGSKNYLYTSPGSTPQGLSDWTISITSDGTATIAAPYKNGSAQRYMMYNYNSSFNLLFSTYLTSVGQNRSLMRIFRKTVLNGNPYDDDPVLEKSGYGAYRNGTDRVYVAGADQLSREYNGGTLTFAILSPGTAEVLELGGIPADPLVGDTFTLVCREIRGVVIEERQYFVTALRVDGSKVWLSDRKGNGFIVRR